MDNKQIEVAVRLLTEMKDEWKGITVWEYKHEIETLLSLAQLFLSVKGAPQKKELPFYNCATQDMRLELRNEWYRIVGYNLCHDEFTAWLAGRMKELEEEIYAELKRQYKGKRLPTKLKIKDLATAIKTMIME